MALTEKSVINRTRELTGLSEQQLPRPRILALIRDARVELSRRKRSLLRKAYSAITSTSGVAPLTTPLANTDPINTELISTAEIYAAGTTRKLQWLPDLSLLNEERPAAFGYFTLVGTDLRIRVAGADFSGSVTIGAATYVPALATITRAELEAEFIKIITEMILGTAQAEAAA